MPPACSRPPRPDARPQFQLNKRLLLDAVLGIAILWALLLGLSFGLEAFGLGAPTNASNWSRGFDANARYILPDPEVEGGYVTQFQFTNGKEQQIAPRSDRPRVLLFGGSNTHGFPAGYLMRELNKKSKRKRPWEVINLGRSGYGSARVRIIFEQALELLDPDLVVLYAGHNEFVERGFALDLEDGDRPSDSGLAALARSTRLYRSFANHYAQSTDQAKAPIVKPEAWKWEYEKFSELTYGETKAQMGAYQDNVRAMCEMARERKVEVLLSTIVHNRLSMPFVSTIADSISPTDRENFRSLRTRALALFPPALKPLMPTSSEERVHGFDYGKGEPRKSVGKAVLRGSRELSGRLKGRPHMLQQESRWKPKVRVLDTALHQLHNRVISDEDRIAVEQAEGFLREALTLVPDHPHALFELGLCEILLGRSGQQIHEHLEQAASFDRAPRKGSDMQNELVRQVAQEVDGVVLCDVDSQFEACMPMNVIGWEVMTDHCHMTLGARHVVMEIFAETIDDEWPKGSFDTKGSQ